MITCAFENGKEVSLRHLTTGVIIINDNNEVLLVKRAPSLSRGGKYTIPGGYSDRDETMEEGALRELKEETGYIGEIISLFHINSAPQRAHEDRQNVDMVYIAKTVGGKITENAEASEIKWFKQEDLPGEEEFAFDHRETILKYYQYRKQAFQLPLIDKLS